METNLLKIEEKILNFWKKDKTFEKSLQKRKKDFIFYEGPPTANAKPGIHHVLSRVFKDVVCRYKTMRGFRVLRKAGWDTHGLPVELEIEKKLGTKTKKDIEKFGIEKFNSLCKKSVFEYKKDWEKLTERIGFWLDLKNAYITFDPEYIETVWFILKKLWEKGLLYEDLRVSPYCPRCQTVLSSHEVAQGYKRIKEPAIYVKFKILNSGFKNTSLLVWTTTPWTLPANVAVAANPNFDYLIIKVAEEFLILAKERMKSLNIEGEIVKEIKGTKLVGLKYQPPFNFYQPDSKKEKAWEVLPADFVSLEEGTGLVHIAPAFGEEDMELIKTQNSKLKAQNLPTFPIILNVDEEGRFKLEVKKFAGLFVKEADPLIIQDLKERGLLFKEELYEHDYPFCWRCKTPLIYYAKKSWFIKMTKVKEDLIKNNQKINWIPAHLKEGRFGEWLKEVKDWALSRERYWGTPLPIWECENCHFKVAIGSLKELKEQKFSNNRYLILRHGESESNLQNLLVSEISNAKNFHLTEKGKEEIKRAAEKLKKEKVDLIFSSDLERCKETAEIVGKYLNIKPKFDKRLREIKGGELENKPLEEVFAFWKSFEERFKKRPKGGENYNDVKKRMINFIESLEKKYSQKTILIISHQRPLTMLEGAMEGWKIEEFFEVEKTKIKNGELREIVFRKLPYNKEGDLDFHRPYIDEVEFFCPKCQGKMKRNPAVIDCWFDSGSMPFAQNHWLNKKPPKLFPADYITEGIDQTRGWFYTLLAISTLLGFGPPYKNVIALGHVLDEKGEKMSKSKGNVVDPFLMLKKHGAEAIRWYFFTFNQPWDPKIFSQKAIEDAKKKFILIFLNCYSFFETYGYKKNLSFKIPKSKSILDEWILSRYNSLLQKVINLMERYEITLAAREIENFVVEDLSLWYIRRSRKRFQLPKNQKELKNASQILGFVLLSLSRILAPFLPFLADHIFQKVLKKEKSVHLEKYPNFDQRMIKPELEEKMEEIRKIVADSLSQRAAAKIKIRQPLLRLYLKNIKLKKEKELLELIKEEVNVKEIVFNSKMKENVKLETEIPPQLKKEGIFRELIRQIQQTRKELKLTPKDRIIVAFQGKGLIFDVLKEQESEIKEICRIRKIEDWNEGEVKNWQKKEIKIDEEKILIAIKK